jgi:hypothetical protein
MIAPASRTHVWIYEEKSGRSVAGVLFWQRTGESFESNGAFAYEP